MMRWLLGLFLLLAVAGTVGIVRTKRATAHGPVVAAPAAPAAVAIRAEGRVITGPEGRIVVRAEAGGTVDKVLVVEGTTLKAGEPLLVFRSSEQLAAAGEARAIAYEAATTARYLDDEVRRMTPLVASGAVPRTELDRLVYARASARAKLGAASASSQRQSIVAGRARILAPMGGTVIHRSVEPGETVPATAVLFEVADLSRLRVEAEVDEYDALRVTRGMRATISVDGLPGASFSGEIDEIGAIVTARSIRPQDPTRPTEPQVLKVKITLDGTTPLKLGQRVNVALSPGPVPEPG